MNVQLVGPTDPLRPQPVRLGVVGVGVGLFFGVLELVQGGPLPPHVFLGCATGFGLGGTLIGWMLPLMRRRLIAGLVVAFSASCGLTVVLIIWRMTADLIYGTIMGVGFGLFYALFYWPKLARWISRQGQ